MLYFLSSSTVEDKAKHICQLFSHMPAATVSNKIWPQASLRSEKEINVILGTIVEVSLVILPTFASEVCLKNYQNGTDQITNLDFGEIKSYSKMLSDFKSLKDRLVSELSKKLFREEFPNIVYNQDINCDNLKTLKKLSAKEFIERSKKYFCHLYSPRGIIEEAKKELD